MIDPFETGSEQGRLVIRRFALARATIVAVVALACGILHLKRGFSFDLTTAYLYAIFAIALIESLMVVMIVAMGYSPTRRFSFLLLCADLVLISAIVTMTGASRSVFAFLYIAAILSTSILLTFNWTVLVATICSALFLAVTILEQSGYVMAAVVFYWPEPPMVSGDMWAYAGMKVFAFYLTAFLAGCLSRRVGLLQALQQNILDSFTSGFLSVSRDCVVTFINPAGLKLLRRSRADTVGKHVSTVLSVTDGEVNPLEQSIAERKECQSREIGVIRGDGKQIPVGVTVSPVRNGARLIGAVASFADLTDFKRMEERLRRADRLAAVGEMSAMLAHEVRNPVASIRGAVQELSENLAVEGANGQLVKIAVRECDHLNKIISDFLEFVGARLPVKERFDVNQLVEEVVHVTGQGLSNNNISILKEYQDVGSIMGDRGQIKEALFNVMSNGADAMPRGGSLRVLTRSAPDSHDGVIILIQDGGEGLEPGELQRIFDPFYSTKRRGTGLGMAVAHRIIASHGGTIDVESTRGSGTTVTIMLPREN